MIFEIVKLARAHNFYGGGEHIEIAKGKNQLVMNWKGFKRKTIRLWQLKKKL